MIKWTIEYVDYNGDSVKEDFYFNLNKAEIMEMNLEANGAYAEYLQKIVDQRDGKKLAHEFKRLILSSYGEKSADGRRFVKSKELADAFVQTEAYSELYLELMTDPEACERFVRGIMPEIPQDNKPDAEKHMSLL